MSIFSCFSPSSTADADCCTGCGISCRMSRRSLSSLPARFMSSVFRFSSMVFPPSCPSSKDMPPKGKKELLSHSQKTAPCILCQKGGSFKWSILQIPPFRQNHSPQEKASASPYWTQASLLWRILPYQQIASVFFGISSTGGQRLTTITDTGLMSQAQKETVPMQFCTGTASSIFFIMLLCRS